MFDWITFYGRHNKERTFFTWILESGETFTTSEVMMVYSEKGRLLILILPVNSW